MHDQHQHGTEFVFTNEVDSHEFTIENKGDTQLVYKLQTGKEAQLVGSPVKGGKYEFNGQAVGEWIIESKGMGFVKRGSQKRINIHRNEANGSFILRVLVKEVQACDGELKSSSKIWKHGTGTVGSAYDIKCSYQSTDDESTVANFTNMKSEKCSFGVECPFFKSLCSSDPRKQDLAHCLTASHPLSPCSLTECESFTRLCNVDAVFSDYCHIAACSHPKVEEWPEDHVRVHQKNVCLFLDL